MKFFSIALSLMTTITFFCFRVAKYLFSKIFFFFKNYFKELALVLLIFLVLFGSRYFVKFLLTIEAVTALIFFVIITGIFFVIYVYLASIDVALLKDHQGFISTFGILIAVILFFLQQEVIRRNEIAHDKEVEFKQIVKYEAALKEENNRNYPHLESIKTDLANNPETFFWKDFSLVSYKEYWSYINLYHTSECFNHYADLTVRLEILNNMNKIRRDLLLAWSGVPKHWTSEMQEAASSTMPIFSYIIKNCQKN